MVPPIEATVQQEPGGRSPAPGQLAIVQRFLNTADAMIDSELLETPAALVAWLHEQELVDRGFEATQADLHQALALREALRAVAFANNGGPRGDEALRLLDRTARRAEFDFLFRYDGPPELEPGVNGIDGALGRLLAIVAEAMRADAWRRLKRCPEENCRWVFFDHSRNLSSHWCAMRVCGNRAKKRAYRARAARGHGA